MAEPMQAVHRSDYSTVVWITAAQMAKTDSMANVMGHRLQDDPAPILYVAPTKNFVEGTWEPRFRAMVRGVAYLWKRLVKGKGETKTRKRINGVGVRFAWSNSPTELAGETAALVLLDELDRMPDDVGGEGDPKTLADNRHATYADGKTVAASTPTVGTVETYVDEHGLERWAVSDQVQSAIWNLWQESTRHEFAWPCPSCGDYFVPRMKLLWWPKVEGDDGELHSCEPHVALDQARMVCPHCGTLIEETHKQEMLERGTFVAPGQRVDRDGQVHGEPPPSQAIGYWTSGLCSPWKSWGQRAYTLLTAYRSGDPEKVQAAINTGFAELYSVSGEAPEPTAVEQLREPYRFGAHLDQVEGITCGVDVQKDRLYYVVRGWGQDSESWQLEHGELHGATDKPEVWNDLALLFDRFWCGLSIERMFVDSGYRASQVYEFCQRHRLTAFPTKGHDTQDRPLKKSMLEVTTTGKVKRGGLALWHLNTDYFKRWIHERIERDPELPGGFHLSEDTTDDYCRQLVAEARVVKRSGRVVWVRLRNANHYLDCEALCYAAAHSLSFHLKTSSEPAPGHQQQAAPAAHQLGGDPAGGVDPFVKGDAGGGEYSGWMQRDDD